MPIPIAIILSLSTLWLLFYGTRMALAFYRKACDYKAAEAFVLPQYSADATHLLTYEIRPRFAMPGGVNNDWWIPWYGSGTDRRPGPRTMHSWRETAQCGNAGTILFLTGQAYDANINLVGIDVRNATGTAERDERHRVGSLDDGTLFKMLELAYTKRECSHRPLQIKELEAERITALNNIVNAIDAMIAKYEGQA